MDDLPKSSRNFPYKLFQLLEDASEKGNEDIVSWLPHGKAFKVYNQDLFEAQIMKKYFRQSKYRSFVRQLYHYRFGRIDYGVDKGAYFHPNFQRSNKSLAIAVSRIPPTIDFRHSLLAQTQSSVSPQLAIAASGAETRSEKKLTIDGLLKRDQTSRNTMMEGRSVVTKKHEPSSKSTTHDEQNYSKTSTTKSEDHDWLADWVDRHYSLDKKSETNQHQPSEEESLEISHVLEDFEPRPLSNY